MLENRAADQRQGFDSPYSTTGFLFRQRRGMGESGEVLLEVLAYSWESRFLDNCRVCDPC